MGKIKILFTGDVELPVFCINFLIICSKNFLLVQNLWTSLCVSMWECCGKVLHMLLKNKFYTKMWAKLEVFHVVVEKFYLRFTHSLTERKAGFCTVSTDPTITTINII